MVARKGGGGVGYNSSHQAPLGYTSSSRVVLMVNACIRSACLKEEQSRNNFLDAVEGTPYGISSKLLSAKKILNYFSMICQKHDFPSLS